jgi:hypothetical protein
VQSVESDESEPTFQRDMSSPSSWLKNKPCKKPTLSRQQAEGFFFFCLDYSSALKMDATYYLSSFTVMF